MRVSQTIRFPLIEKRQPSRSINQIIRSRDQYSLEKTKILKAAHENSSNRGNYSARKTSSKAKIQLVNKWESSLKEKQTTANTLTTETSGTDVEKCSEHTKKLCDLRGLINKVMESDSIIYQKTSHRKNRYKEPFDDKHLNRSKDSKKKQDLPKIKNVEWQSDLNFFSKRSQKTPLKRSKPKQQKITRQVMNAIGKVCKPVQGLNGALSNFRFDDQISPWQNQMEI